MSVVDHIIIAVADLEAASQDYALMLGRAPSWRGTHPDYGSANTLFRLENCYLELLAANGEGWAGDMIKNVLETRGQSLCALVFGTEDCDAFLDNARANGLDVADPVAGHGVDDASGAARSWRNMHWEQSAARGIFSFCICHDDLSALPMAEPTGAGAMSAVDHVVVQTKSADAAKKFYGDQLGIRLALEHDVPDWGGTQLFFRTNSMSVEVIASDKTGDDDNLWGLALKTDDIVVTQKRLSYAGIKVSDVRDGRKPGTKVCTIKSHVMDVPTLLIEHPKN
ncbi:MAG: VOC family protein [Alphaproteobacteria bacterium]|nr:VOC family protein [Alphaproteobacteria bacterium]